MPKSYAQMVEEARAAVTCTSSEDLKARLDAGEDLLLIDVREPQEWVQGTLPGSYTIPRGVLEGQIDGRVPYESRVVLYCGSGARRAPGQGLAAAPGSQTSRTSGWTLSIGVPCISGCASSMCSCTCFINSSWVSVVNSPGQSAPPSRHLSV